VPAEKAEGAEKHECYHTPDCPKKLPVQFDKTCNQNCGGRNCIHWAEVTPGKFVKCEHHAHSTPGKCDDCKPSPEKEERAASHKVKGRKPWIDYDKDGDPQSLFFTDEQGNLMRRVGRRARRQGTQFAINAASGNYGSAALLESLNIEDCPNGGFEKVGSAEVTGKPQHLRKGLIFGPRRFCTVQDCSKKCGNPHKKDKNPATKFTKVKGASDKKKAAEKKTECRNFKEKGTCSYGDKCRFKHEKKEALVNGPQFAEGKFPVHESIMIAKTDKNRMCAVRIWNGIATMAHIFKDCVVDAITFSKGDCKVELKKEEGKLVGRDLLFFPYSGVGKEGAIAKMRSLRAADPVVGKKSMLVTYTTEEDCAKANAKRDIGVIKSVEREPMKERALYTASSMEGNCGSPVIDTDGRVIGFHDATLGTENVFIPITPAIVALATGSQSSF
jgi:hypothetical protein